MNNQPQTLQVSWEKIQLLCLKQGKSLQELASDTGLSRTTLNNWAKGKISKPHGQKITAIAAALKVSVEEILSKQSNNKSTSSQATYLQTISSDSTSPVSATSQTASSQPATSQTTTMFSKQSDQLHNLQIGDVKVQQPTLFQEWNSKDWDELYSEFGVGGALTPQGVAHSADLINRKKEIFRKLEIVLESDLADLAEAIVRSFYHKIQANPEQQS
jgi:transcriptional regulator with XRE-family HTH domain